MTFQKNTLGYIESKINALAVVTALIRRSMLRKLWYFFRFTFLWPYFIVLGLCVWLFSFLKTPDSKRFSVWFVKHYFRLFFRSRNVDWYTVFEIGPLEPSTIILTTRTHWYGFAFVLQLFSDSVIVPMPSGFHRLKMVPFIFYLKLSRFLKLCSYPDQELPSALPNIHALLQAGYSVVVPINRGNLSSNRDNTLTMYKQTFDLLKLNYPCYFLSTNGFDTIDTATTKTPALVSVKLKEKQAVLVGTDPIKPEATLRLTEFFEYRYLTTL